MLQCHALPGMSGSGRVKFSTNSLVERRVRNDLLSLPDTDSFESFLTYRSTCQVAERLQRLNGAGASSLTFPLDSPAGSPMYGRARQNTEKKEESQLQLRSSPVTTIIKDHLQAGTDLPGSYPSPSAYGLLQ